MQRICLLVFILIFTVPVPVKAEADVITPQSAATSLLLVAGMIALVLGVLRVMKRSKVTDKQGNSSIRLMSQMPLGQRERILVLEVNNERLLVGVTANQINLISKLEVKPALCEQAEVKKIKRLMEDTAKKEQIF